MEKPEVHVPSQFPVLDTNALLSLCDHAYRLGLERVPDRQKLLLAVDPEGRHVVSKFYYLQKGEYVRCLILVKTRASGDPSRATLDMSRARFNALPRVEPPRPQNIVIPPLRTFLGFPDHLKGHF